MPSRRRSGWDDPFSPNVYLKNDPKPLLKELETYAL